jgi:hypothetical protein
MTSPSNDVAACDIEKSHRAFAHGQSLCFTGENERMSSQDVLFVWSKGICHFFLEGREHNNCSVYKIITRLLRILLFTLFLVHIRVNV